MNLGLSLVKYILVINLLTSCNFSCDQVACTSLVHSVILGCARTLQFYKWQKCEKKRGKISLAACCHICYHTIISATSRIVTCSSFVSFFLNPSYYLCFFLPIQSNNNLSETKVWTKKMQLVQNMIVVKKSKIFVL